VQDEAPVISHHLMRTDLVRDPGAPGEILSTKIVVTAKEETPEEKTIVAELMLLNQDGEVKLNGRTRELAVQGPYYWNG
jgi:hypothetical protein